MFVVVSGKIVVASSREAQHGAQPQGHYRIGSESDIEGEKGRRGGGRLGLYAGSARVSMKMLETPGNSQADHMTSKLRLCLRQLFAFWRCLIFLAIACATTFAHDYGGQTKQAHDGTTNAVFRYDFARVLATHENPNRLPTGRTFSAAPAKCLAAKGGTQALVRLCYT